MNGKTDYFINDEITVISPKENQTVYLVNDYTRRWLNAPSYEQLKADYGKGERLKAKPLTLSWKFTESASFFSIKITNDDGDIIIKNTEKQRLTVKDLKVGKNYVWEVTAYINDVPVIKKQSKFKTALTPRIIDLKGVSGARDVAFFSNDVKQGLIFRSANLDGLTKSGKAAAKHRYNVKTEIDLRRGGEGTAGTYSPVKGANYYNYSGAFYVRTEASLLDPVYQKNVADTISVFANKDNYPILFHCFAGRDRTGTIAVLLQALLGANYKDIKTDYEISFLTSTGCMDGALPEIMIPQFNSLMDYLINYSDKSLSENTEKFLIDIGVSKSDLNSIKSIMSNKS